MYAIRHAWLPLRKEGGYLKFAHGAVRGPANPGKLTFVSDVEDATQFPSVERLLETLQQIAHNGRGWVGDLSIVKLETKVITIATPLA